MAGRAIDSATAAALDTRNYALAALVELDFASGMLRLHSGPVGHVISWNGHEWLGTGSLGSISTIEESDELAAGAVEFSMSGIDTSMVAAALNEDYLDRPARIWLCIMDADHQLVGEPVGPFSHTMDVMEGVVGSTATLNLTAVNRLADWARPRLRRYTDEDQQAEFPGDLGMEFVSQMVDKELVW